MSVSFLHNKRNILSFVFTDHGCRMAFFSPLQSNPLLLSCLLGLKPANTQPQLAVFSTSSHTLSCGAHFIRSAKVEVMITMCNVSFSKGSLWGIFLIERDMQNANRKLAALLATWLHVYSFSSIYRPMTNECPKHFRHSATDLVQATSLIKLKRTLILRKTGNFHR